MIQRKRQQFQKQIRRKHLEKMFKEKRFIITQNPNFSQYLHSYEYNPNAKMISQQIQAIIVKLGSSRFSEIHSNFEQLQKRLEQNVYQSSAYILINTKKLTYILFNAMKNEQSIEEIYDQWKSLSVSSQFQLIDLLFNLLQSLNYTVVDQQSFTRLLNTFWRIFNCQSIDIYSEKMHRIFDLILKIIKKMLNSKNKTVLTTLKNIGLGSKISNIIQNHLNILTIQNEYDLIEIIDIYIQLQNEFRQNEYSNNINGVVILGIQSSQKQGLLAFGLYMVDKKIERSMASALNVINNILAKHQYLADSIEDRSAKQIFNLIDCPIRTIQARAFQVIDMITCHNGDICKLILQEKIFVDKLYEMLQKQAKFSDEYTKNIVICSSNVMSNLTFVKGKLQKQYIKHPIWQLAYHHINMYSPLRYLVTVFQYYFERLERQFTMKFMDSFLYSISQLDLALIQKGEVQSIKRAIVRVFVKSQDHWDEVYLERLRRMLRQHKLMYFLEDFMEIEEQELQSL